MEKGKQKKDDFDEILDGDEYNVPVTLEERNVKTGKVTIRKMFTRCPRVRELEDLDAKEAKRDIAKFGCLSHKRIYLYISIFDIETDEKLRGNALLREQRTLETIRDFLETYRDSTLRDVQETFLRSGLVTCIIAIKKARIKNVTKRRFVYNNKRKLCEYTFVYTFGNKTLVEGYFKSEGIENMEDNLKRLALAGHILTEEECPK